MNSFQEEQLTSHSSFLAKRRSPNKSSKKKSFLQDGQLMDKLLLLGQLMELYLSGKEILIKKYKMNYLE